MHSCPPCWLHPQVWFSLQVLTGCSPLASLPTVHHCSLNLFWSDTALKVMSIYTCRSSAAEACTSSAAALSTHLHKLIPLIPDSHKATSCLRRDYICDLE